MIPQKRFCLGNSNCFSKKTISNKYFFKNTKNPRPFSPDNLPQKIPIDKNFQKTREEKN
jgi:hypothetical protein